MPRTADWRLYQAEGTAAAKGLGQDPGLSVPSPELPPPLTTEEELQKREKPGSKTGVRSFVGVEELMPNFQFLAGSFQALVFTHGRIVPSSKSNWVSREFEMLAAKPPSCSLHPNVENPQMWHFHGKPQ